MGHPVNEDRFRLIVDGQEIALAKSYTVNASVFTVPAVFSMVVGHNGLLASLLNAYCEETPFELFVNDVRVMQGEIDDLSAVGNDETSLKVSGRDRLARLSKSEMHSDRTFTECTFTDLTEAALKEVGLGDVSLVSSNLANRKAITGKYKAEQIVSPAQESTDTELEQTIKKRTSTVHKSLIIESGSTWWDFLQPQYQRGGLFLWADSFGGFVLGQPNGKQAPSYRILRRSTGKGESGDVTILGQPEFHRSTRGRYSEFHVSGRKGSGVNGRDFAFSKQIDPEMVALLNPEQADRADGGRRKEIKVYVDNKCKTPEQSAFLALRKMAESRRNAFTLNYTVSGHTVDALSGGGRLVWQPDTTVHVIDEVLGIDEPMYVDDVTYDRAVNAKSMCKISLMRCEDLLFGEEDLVEVKKKVAAPRKATHMIEEGFSATFWQKNPTWGNLPTLHTLESHRTFKKGSK